MHRNLLGFSRKKRDTIKSNQCLHGELYAFWALLRCIQVDLWNFVATNVAGVLHTHGDVQAVVRRSDHMKIRVAEGAIGEPVSKRKKRLNLLFVEPAIAYVHTFREGRFASHSLSRALRMGGVGRRIVLKTFSPRKRQSSARAYSAEKNIRRGPSAFISRPPHLQNGLHLSNPWHGDRLAYIEHNNCIRINRRDFVDEFILFARKAEVRFPARPEKDHRRMGVLCRVDRLLMIATSLIGCQPVQTNLLLGCSKYRRLPPR